MATAGTIRIGLALGYKSFKRDLARSRADIAAWSATTSRMVRDQSGKFAPAQIFTKQFAAHMVAGAGLMARHGKLYADKFLGSMVQSFAGGAQALVGSLLNPVTWAAGFAAVGYVVVDSAKKMKDIADASETLGISTDEFQQMAYAARFAEMSQDELLQSMIKVRAFSRKATIDPQSSEAYQLADALQAVNVSIDDFSKLDASKQYTTLMKGIQGMSNSLAKLDAATEIAGAKKAARWIDASRDIAKNMQYAKDNGLILTESQIRGGASAAEAWTRIEASVAMVKDTFAAELMPIIERASQWLQDPENMRSLVEGAREFAASFVMAANAFAQIIGRPVQLAAQAYGGIVSASQLPAKGLYGMLGKDFEGTAAQSVMRHGYEIGHMGDEMSNTLNTLWDASTKMSESIRANTRATQEQTSIMRVKSPALAAQ